MKLRVTADEEFPSSFTKKEGRVKTPFPWLRKYMFRRKLSFAVVASIFVIVGVAVSFVIMEMNDLVPDFGKLNSINFFFCRIEKKGKEHNRQ